MLVLPVYYNKGMLKETPCLQGSPTQAESVLGGLSSDDTTPSLSDVIFGGGQWDGTRLNAGACLKLTMTNLCSKFSHVSELWTLWCWGASCLAP